jgi:hypothetical protein
MLGLTVKGFGSDASASFSMTASLKVIVQKANFILVIPKYASSWSFTNIFGQE